MEVGWDFFATNLGKFAIIGIGGPIKPLTARAGLQRPYNNQILSEETIYQFYSKTIKNISFNLIERDTSNLLLNKLACQYEHGETVPGTCSYHQCCPVSADEICYKRVMDDKDLACSFTFSKAANPKVSFHKISANEHVTCYYDSNWWVGLVQNVNCDEKDVETIFLHPPGPSNNFTWPKRKDVCWVPYMNVICKIRPSITTACKKSK